MGFRATVLAIATVAVFVVLGGCALADDYYVDGTNGTDDTSHGGSTGTEAWKTITYALAQITGSSANPHTIHIAASTYTPHTNGETFPLNMEDYVSLSGEDETTTVLDAWRGANHVLYCDNVDDFTIEDLTIKGGYAYPYDDSYGAGIYFNYSSPTLANCTITGNEAYGWGWNGVGGGICSLYSSPTLTNCTISGNTATDDGGGIAWVYGSPTLTNCTISGNTAAGYGGGIRGANSSAVLTGCTISGNAVNWDGGGIYFSGESYPTLTNCSISGNRARSYDGGGINCWGYASPRLTDCSINNNSGRYGGGMCCWSGWATLINCTMSGNAATSGGAMCCLGESAPTLTNCTLSANGASYGGGIYCYNSDSHPTIRNSILWGDSPNEIEGYTSGFSVTYSDVEGGWSGTGNINEDPEFIVGYYLSQTASGETTDSPCVDSGSDTAANLELDDRNTRTDGVNDSGQVDMGYHYDHASQSTDYYVDNDNGDDTNDGLSWASAFSTVQQGLDSCTTGSGANSDIVHVAAQTYYQNIVLNRNYTSLLGGYPPGGGDRDSVTNQTVIDGGAANSVITIDSRTQVMIDGFTIQNGSAASGGGIYCCDSDATVTACTISGNNADKLGGAICAEASSINTSDCIIMDNTSGEFGGAIYAGTSSVDTKNCLIVNNTAAELGGAIYTEAGSVEMGNSIITNNVAEIGGGMFCCDECSVDLLNCLIAHNMADYGGAIYCYLECALSMGSCTIADNTASGWVGGVYVEASSNLEVLNSIFYGNSAEQVYVTPMSSVDITYSDVEGGWSGEGNIDEDPLFVPTGDPPFEYYLAHTGAQAGDSPCLDAGYGDVADYGLADTTTCTDGREDGDDDSDGGTGPIDMGYHYAEGYDGDGDSYIELVSFEARSAGPSIAVTWETGAEIRNAGFVLFREIAGTQNYVQISDLISAQGTPTSGASYSFTDADVEPGITYNYWLVDIETSGNWAAHGPATATATSIIPHLCPEDSGMVLR